MTPLTRVLRWFRAGWLAPDPAPDLSWLDRKDGLDTRYCGAFQPSAKELANTRTWLETRRDILARASADARADLHATLRAEGCRYDAEWPSVHAAEAGGWAGGDLAAMAAPFVTLTITPDVSKFRAQMDRAATMAAPLPGMARDDLGTYAEPVTVLIEADVSRFRDEMAHTARKVAEAALYPLYQIGPDGVVTVVPEPPDWPRHRDGFIDSDGNPAHVPAEPVKPRGRHRQTDPLDLILADLRDLDWGI